MKMEIEKRRSRGGLLSLFDWNGKSKKKLLYNNANPPEDSKLGNQDAENMLQPQLNRIKLDENGPCTSYTANCDFNCALSTNSDEGYGSKAPGLVARLMGLDSLPASTEFEVSSSALYGPNSLRSSHFHDSALDSMSIHPVDYVNMPLKLERSSWDAIESKAQKVQKKPIKRFQTEMLPPKSAKPIPVTHNKLLSPIKSPGFFPPKNAAHIMEAAAKIIDASPRPYTKNKVSTSGSPSVPLRILDLKEKLEAAPYAPVPGKVVHLSAVHPVKGKPSDRSNNVYKCTPAFKGSRDSGQNGSTSHHLATKREPTSPAMQVKPKVQSRDTLTSNTRRRGHMKQKDQNEIKPNQSRSQKPVIHQPTQQRTCMPGSCNVLGQNNQKQNSATSKAKSTSRVSHSSKSAAQIRSSENSSGPSKMTNKGAVNVDIGSKRSSRRGTDTQRDVSLSKTRSISQKKRYSSRDVNEARVTDNAVSNFENKIIKCNITTDGSMNQDALNMKESKDVISFTFTSPLRRSMPETQPSTELTGAMHSIGINFPGHSDEFHPKKLSLSPPGVHMIDGDDLGVLLETKLQELTSRINSPPCTLVIEDSSAGFRSSLQENVPGEGSNKSREQDRSFHPRLLCDKLDNMHTHTPSDEMVIGRNQHLQGSEATEEHGYSSNSEIGNGQGSQHSGTATVLETPPIGESYLDSEDSAYGSTVYSSMQDEEVSNVSPIYESVSLESEVESSEQSSSAVSGNMAIKQSIGISNLMGFKKSRNSELEYVKDILNNAELMAEDFVLGHSNEVIMPNLFDLLENQSNGTESYEEGYSKLCRKILFDCVNECLELRCRQAFVGSCNGWPRWMTSVQRKSWLAEDLYMEMLGFKRMEEAMVDELVSMDMSTGYGKWLDFDIEAFEEGLEIEWDLSTSLINELVSDLVLA